MGTEYNAAWLNAGGTRDGVHTLAGGYTTTNLEFAILGHGPSPALSRTYNSKDSRFSVLGQGWTHNYNVYLARPTNGAGLLVLVGPHGRSDRYTPNADGSYTPRAGVDVALKKNVDGTFTATHQDQTTWNFDICGRLIDIEDRFSNTSTLTYDPSTRRLSTVSDPANRGNLAFRYDTYTGGATSYTIANGRTMTCAPNRLCEVIDWTGRTVQYGYDSSGRLTDVIHREQMTRSASQRLSTQYAYDGTSSRLLTIKDANGIVQVTNHYDSNGRVDWQRDALNNQTSYSYVNNPDGTTTTTVTYPTTSFEPGWNHKVIDHYDARGTSAVSGRDWLLSRTVQPTSAQTEISRYTYTSTGLLSTSEDPRGNTTTFCWDTDYVGTPITGSLGNLTRVISPVVTDARTQNSSRAVSLFNYDTKRNLIESVAPNGVSSTSSTACNTPLTGFDAQFATSYTYDGAGQKLLSVARRFSDSELGSQTSTTQYQYNDSANPGRVTGVVSPRNNTTTLEYFAPGACQGGMLKNVTDPLGNKTSHTYDCVGRLLTTLDPIGNSGATGDHTWMFGFDAEDRLTSSSSPAPTSGAQRLSISATYDPVGNRLSQTDAKGQITRYVYDDRNQLEEVQQSATMSDPSSDPDKIRTTYVYDNLANLKQVTRANGSSDQRVTDYLYDGRGRLRKESEHPGTGTLDRLYAYDGNSNLISFQDAKAPPKVTASVYDALNRMTNITYNDPPLGDYPGTANVTYAYDLDGNRRSMQDGTGTTTYAPDELGRLKEVTSPGTGIVRYWYDLDGNLRQLGYPNPVNPNDPPKVRYSFDAAGRMKWVADWAAPPSPSCTPTQTPRTTCYTSDPDGRVKEAKHVNGTVSLYDYDNARRLRDLRHRLGTTDFFHHTDTLDATGNRTGIAETIVEPSEEPETEPHTYWYTYTYTYDNLYRLTIADTPYAYTEYDYDRVGNRTNRSRTDKPSQQFGSINYAYDTADRLTQVGTTPYSSDNNGNLSEGAPDSFVYDQADRLIRATLGGTPEITESKYDGDGLRASRKRGSNPWEHYVRDVNRTLPVVLVDADRKYIWGLDLLYHTNLAGEVQDVHHHDGLGTTRVLTTSLAGLEAGYQLDEYGITVQTGGFGSSGQPFRFTGEQWDGNDSMGVLYLRSRFYRPDLGRFLSRDTFSGHGRQPASLHRFGYAHNNPVVLVDRSGHDSLSWALDDSADIELELGRCPVPLDLEVLQMLADATCSLTPALQKDEDLVATHVRVSPGLPELGILTAESPNKEKKVREILKGKKGSIKQAELPPGSPSWDDILDETWEQIVKRAKERLPGYDTIRKLLTDRRFNKSQRS